MSRNRPTLAVALILALSGACSGESQEWPSPGWADFELGGPLPGLTDEKLARWHAGYEQFTRVFAPEEGLGPAFNENTCDACHSDSVTGGTMHEPDYHATAQLGDNCDYLVEEGGGNLRKQMTPEGQAIFGIRKEPRPLEATHFGRFNPSVLFGRGLIAAALTDYLMFLAPPPQAVPVTEEGRANVARGRAASFSSGCGACHTEVMYTGPNEVEALDRRPVYLYSDLLLHDMRLELADACGKEASPSVLRTEPLSGVRYKRGWMHHGRTPTLRRAMEMHGGEGAFSRALFQTLSPPDQEALIHFLRTL